MTAPLDPVSPADDKKPPLSASASASAVGHHERAADQRSASPGEDGVEPVKTEVGAEAAADDVDELTPEQERRLVRKIDLRLVPILSLLYLLSFLDRTAIGNARLYGLEKDINITGSQYNWALTTFFFPYALFEVPSNVLLKSMRPTIWFPLIMVLWGIAMLSQGLVHNYSGLVAARFFLGVFEAGLFPGAQFLLSSWYRRSEFGLRSALFFSAATVSGAFGGLLAAAIHNMDGIGGKAGWSWIFILEGLLTVVLGGLSYFVLVDFPDTATFLTEKERAAVVRRLQKDQQFSAGGEHFRWQAMWDAMWDWKTWIASLVYVGSDMPLYAFSLFTPTIIKALGYQSTAANLLSVPIYVFACIVTCIVGVLADRTGKRGLYNLIFMCIGVAGYIILITTTNNAVSYFAIYLASAGIYPLIANTVAWVGNNTEGSYKRSVVMAIFIGFGNINGAVSSNVYMTKDSPRYRLGHGLVLMYIGIGIISTLVYMWGLDSENKKRERGERDEIIDPTLAANSTMHAKGMLRRIPWTGGTFASAQEARAVKGDLWSGFRYVI